MWRRTDFRRPFPVSKAVALSAEPTAVSQCRLQRICRGRTHRKDHLFSRLLQIDVIEGQVAEQRITLIAESPSKPVIDFGYQAPVGSATPQADQAFALISVQGGVFVYFHKGTTFLVLRCSVPAIFGQPRRYEMLRFLRWLPVVVGTQICNHPGLRVSKPPQSESRPLPYRHCIGVKVA